MTRIGLLHPGEMGAVVGAQLGSVGHEVLWASAGRSAATAARAHAAGATDVVSLAALAAAAEVMISICPPHAAREVAEQLEGFDGPYVDANAVAPATVRSLAPLQPGLVDGGIIGPPPHQAGTTRLYLSGRGAAAAAQLFSGTTLDVQCISEEIGAASALKMAYAAWTKGTAALLLGIRAVAQAEGVEPALLAEWELSQPQLVARSAGAAPAAATKGWRWRGEMEEIAATFGAAGLPEGFHHAAAEIFMRTRPATVDGEDPVAQVLAALLADQSARGGQSRMAPRTSA